MAALRKSIAIDLGTASILVYLKGKGVVINEPSVLAVDSYSGKILAVGTDAKKMLGRTPGHILATRPMKDGVIADYKATETMLRYFIRKAIGRNNLIQPDVIICVPSKVTQVQKRAVLQATRSAGANKIYLIEEPLAAAIGSGVDISDPGGSLVIDIGGGTTDVAVISLGGIVISESSNVAGDKVDSAITEYIRKKYNMIIGERTAEDIKIGIASAFGTGSGEVYEVRGRNLVNGLPMHVFVTKRDIAKAIEGTLEDMVQVVKWVLEKTPPELSADIYERGALLSGGGAMIKDLDLLIKEEIGIEVKLADNPISSVVKGTGKALQWIDQLQTTDSMDYEGKRQMIAQQERLRKR